ncbi:MAG: hypothetical protein LUE23_09540 [Lachnospiraceae bacterium]|nr:hypothetical protein [Lachnospiraceae bacterium]
MSRRQTANFSQIKKAIDIFSTFDYNWCLPMHQRKIMKENNNDLADIITQTLDEMKREQGEKFDIDKVNLAELGRRTGISRAKLRRFKANGFVDAPHALIGRKSETTVLTGFTGVIDDLLRKGVTNSSVCFERLKENGYKGGLSVVKAYISEHKDLVPAPRQMVAPQGNRGRRYQTDPGDTYQMDWGFVNVEDQFGNPTQVACFAMICHGCGQRYIEFFPNARQENLFIGMIHAFLYMGVPKHVLTDNMKGAASACLTGILRKPAACAETATSFTSMPQT